MASYRYEAVDARGKPRQGLIDAETPRQVRDQLQGDGLFPTVIEAAGSAGGATTDRQRLRLKSEVVTLVTRQLATLARSGMPLDQALSAVGEQADDARVDKLFTSLRTEIAAGESLAGALGRWPRTFDDLYRGLVAVGAETGKLGEVLERLADYLEARQALKQKFTLALIYPALVTIIALGVITVLLAYVVPQVVSVYQQSRQTLPWLTQALIALSAFFRETWWMWLTLAVAASIAFAVANRREAFRARWHALALKVPALGRLLTAIDTARFASTLAILVGSGAPLLRSLDAAKDVVWALPIRRAAARVSDLVREGVSVTRALK
jgi:general secretion pathway protein F